MYIIKKEVEVEIVEKKSKFITRIREIQIEADAKRIIEEIVKIEKGAVHNCYAYRTLNHDNTILERKSDDGEPGGTAGAPMLAVLTGEEVINAIVVTTRYFGGIKLGTGGLVTVYKRGVKEALKKSGLIKFQHTERLEFEFPINKTDFVQYLLNKKDVSIVKKEFRDKDVTLIIDVPEDSTNALKDMARLVKGKIKKN